MKQTVVEWLQEQYNNKSEEIISFLTEEDFEQAKAMEKEQCLKMPNYDLDELVKSKYPNFYNEDYEYDVEAEMLRDEYKSRGFKEGFQKAIDLLTFKSE